MESRFEEPGHEARAVPATLPSLAAVAAFAAICLAFHAFGEQGWVPVLMADARAGRLPD